MITRIMKIRNKAVFISFAGLILFCGCRSTQSNSEAKQADSPEPSTIITNVAENTSQIITAPEGGFSWDELAKIAARRNSESQLLALTLKRDSLQNKVDRGWRDPQLRLNTSQGDQDEYSRSGNPEHEERDAWSAGLRFYISNPFVNRWIKKQSAKSARLLSANADELAYATYCETKTKCLETAVISDQILQLQTKLKMQQQICREFEILTENGYAAPLKIIKAELKLSEIEQEYSQKKSTHRNRLYQLSLLTGLPVEQIKVQPVDSQKLAPPETLSADSLITFAILSRPDLKRINSEIDLAETEIKVAEAKNIPWFEFAEGGYRDGSSDTTRYGENGNTHSNQDSDEWIIRTGINIPIFSWLGEEVNLAKASLNQARMQELIILNAIKDEIQAGLQNYKEAYQNKVRLENRVNNRLDSFTKQIKEVDSFNTVITPDILELKEQLNSYKQSVRKNLYNCLKLKLYLESVTGERQI